MSALLVVGAGPKAIAIAAKRRVLHDLGWDVPEIIVIERSEMAAHWSGRSGYTDGRQELGTPPEKDIGFPYASEPWGDDNHRVDVAMFELSWPAYLIAKRTDRRSDLKYASWVDRGRPQPSHGEWGTYLRWAAHQVGCTTQIGEVQEIDVADGRWSVRTTTGQHDGDALVITGPGPPIAMIDVSDRSSERVLDGASFWRHLDRFDRVPRQAHVAIVGSGETAAAIAVELHRRLPDDSSVKVISRQGVVYSRGESYDENHLYSNPRRWAQLEHGNRVEFVRRTDRGVFSQAAKAELNDAERVETVAGDVVHVLVEGPRMKVYLRDDPEPVICDFVVDATGFRSTWFLDALSASAAERLRGAVGEELTPEALGDAVEPDLAVRGMEPRLHVPMHAGVTEGPGFPNLSSLGLVADRILARHARPPRAGEG